MSKKRYKELLAGTMAELLLEHPDIDGVEAKIAAAEGLGLSPTADLLQTKRALERVKRATTMKADWPSVQSSRISRFELTKLSARRKKSTKRPFPARKKKKSSGAIRKRKKA